MPPHKRPWSEENLNRARQLGDPLADQLAEEIVMNQRGVKGGRLGYNRLIDLADKLETDPELVLVSESHLAKELNSYPPKERDWYDPTPAPAWVDGAKLQLAGSLWESNSLGMLGALYASSLPACYLIKRGIPALFQTNKLKGRNIYQRIFETGVMLEAVMKKGGIQLIHDLVPDEDSLVLAGLKKVDVEGDWKIETIKDLATGRPSKTLLRKNSRNGPALGSKEIMRAIDLERRTAGTQPSGYLWGNGFIQSRKVRLLHGSIRFMLLNPEKFNQINPPSEEAKQAAAGGCPFHAHANSQNPWPSETMGVPINQEDLAFTLLTFSYCIPKGLCDWGCKLTLEEKEAFLHLWKVVGHIMGLEEELMTDQWAEAEELFGIILKRQGGRSPDGVALTQSVMDFLANYLPSFLNLKLYVPIVLIADLLPDQVNELLSDENRVRLKSVYGQTLRFLVHWVIRIYYRYYLRLSGASRLTDTIFGKLFQHASSELIASWRAEYRRKPLFIPKDLTTWELRRGATPEFEAELQAWRNRVVLGILKPIVVMGLAGVLGFASILNALEHRQAIFEALIGQEYRSLWWLAGCCFLMLLSIWQLDVGLTRICAARPKPDGISAHPNP